MKPILLDYLVCPDCQTALDCQVITEVDQDIETGQLTCPHCRVIYPIVRGIPRFVTTDRPLTGDNIKTADAFGWQWQKFHELHADYQNQFLDWIDPIQPDFFQNKVVLDAGCGNGRFSLVSSQFGAKLVLAIDASEAVEAARENARPFPNVQVIQADLLRLPLRQNRPTQAAQVDFIFCIGVLHHLDEPQVGFKALVRHLQPQGTIFAWVYGRETNGWLVNWVNPIRTTLTSRLPRQVLYAFSWAITVGLHPLVKLVYHPASPWLRRKLPYGDYLAWLGQFGFYHNHHVVFDHLSAPVAFYLRRQEFEAWFHNAGLNLIDLSWRNQNSWRGHGGFTFSQQAESAAQAVSVSR
jgi:SAM-dependent methyltransferase/uncharacterized protein YbaR (Trm112 family)